MTHQSMTATDEHLHVGRLATPAWQAAVDQLADHSPEGAPEELLSEWRAAGIVDGDLAVATDWQRAIDAQVRATAAITLVARMGDVAFLTNLYLCPDLASAVAVTLRTTVGDDSQINLVHPQAEVAMAPMERLWTLLRRVLPPMDAFRADVPAAPSEAFPVEDPADVLLAAESARASVFAYGAQAQGGQSEEAIWYLSDDELLRLSPTVGAVLRVSPGDVASGLLSLASRLTP